MNIARIERAVRQSHVLRTLACPAVVLRRQVRRCRDSAKTEVLCNLERLLAQDPILTLPQFRGDFAVGSHSDLFRIAAATGSYEPKLAEICVRHLAVDRDAIDIGANVGFYTVLFAQLLRSRRVLSIEPTGNALARLRANLELNGVQDRVVVFAGVASDRTGEARLNTVVGREEYSSLGSMTHPRISGSEYDVLAVACETIDNLVQEHDLDPGFVKLDVEGMEHAVLDGMRDVLQSKRPTILLELLDPLLKRNGSSSRLVIDFLRSYGYDVRDPLNQTSDVGNWTWGELLCVPIP